MTDSKVIFIKLHGIITILFIFVLSACMPSESAVQTAIVATEEAKATSTLTPRPRFTLQPKRTHDLSAWCTPPAGYKLSDDAKRWTGCESPCPEGCKEQVEGCNIKGNISFDTQEKIYHLPGDEFYGETKIDPDYGERWFCTEDEAIDNGWRKSEQ